MKKAVSIFLILIIGALSLFAPRLEWDKNCNPAVMGYRVYIGTNQQGSGMPTVIAGFVDDCGNVRSETTNVQHSYSFVIPVEGATNTFLPLTNIIPNVEYYFAVTAYDSDGLESDFSLEVSYMKVAPTNNLKLTTTPLISDGKIYLNLSFPTLSGRQYQLLYCDEFPITTNTEWKVYTRYYSVSDGVYEATLPVGNEPQRFFKVELQ